MGRLSSKAKKDADKLKSFLQPKPRDKSHDGVHPPDMAQRQTSSRACSAHMVVGCRCAELMNDLYKSADAETTDDASLALSHSPIPSASLNSHAPGGTQRLKRRNAHDDTARRDFIPKQPETEQREMDAPSYSSFLLGQPETSSKCAASLAFPVWNRPAPCAANASPKEQTCSKGRRTPSLPKRWGQ